MDLRVLRNLSRGVGKPLPNDRVYLTIKDLAKRYEVSERTIKRWVASDEVLPLTIDSEYPVNRWDIEELKEFEDDIREQIESLNQNNN